MDRKKVLIQHSIDGQSVRHLSFGEGQRIVVGESPSAHIYIAGIDPVEKKAVQGVLEFGSHKLEMTPLEPRKSVFDKNQVYQEKEEFAKDFFQVVVYSDGILVESSVLPNGTVFNSQYFENIIVAGAEQNDWQIEAVSPSIELWKRRVVAQPLTDEKLFSKKTLMPLLALPILLTGFLVLQLFKFSENNTEKPPENAYTRMLYSQEEMRRIQEEAKELLNESFGGAEVAQSNEAAVPNSSEAVKNVVTQLKSSKIQSVLKSIAKASNVSLSQLVKKSGSQSSKTKSGASADARKSLGKIGGKKFKLAAGGPGKKGGSANRIAGSRNGKLARGGVGGAQVQMFEQETKIVGGLEPEEIAKVIRKHLGEVRYCYERQLSSNPDLAGKVQLKFNINAGGAVKKQKIGESSLKNASIEGCILRRVARWKFPKPRGGTTVKVTYPFVLRTTR